MSFHGGLIGILLPLVLFARHHRLNLMRVCDYVACATPFGLILVRIANFINGERWGRPTSLPWGMTFPGAGDDLPRHPSQLYEAGLEGGVMLVVLWFVLGLLRQSDRGLEHLSWGLTMEQTLSIPFMVGGAYFTWRSTSRSYGERITA